MEYPKYYNIHGLVSIEIVSPLAAAIKYIDSRYRYFSVSNLESIDIRLKIFKFNNFHINKNKDKKRHDISEDAIAWRDKRKFGKWQVLIEGLKSGRYEIKFSGNAISYKYLFFYILEPLINMVLMSKGYCLVHASCFALSGESSLVSAYPASGKTSILLRMLEKGADYISDEMTIISKDGFVYMYPTPIVLSDYNMSRYVTDKLGFLSHIKKYILKVVRILTKGFIKLTIQISPERLLNGGKIINSSKIKQVYIIKKGYPEKEDMNNISGTMLRISKVQYDYFAKVIRKHRAKIKDSNLNEYWNNMAEVINSFCQNTKDLYIEKNNNINFDRLKK